MSEDYLHYIWKHGLFETNELKTVGGQSITILKKGHHNHDAGPDFLEGSVQLNETTWAGHIELHVNSSDWTKHNHQKDKAYNNVILHVVYQDDAPAIREDGTEIPTLELKGKIDEMGYWRYEQFVSAKRDLPCGNQVKHMEPLHINAMLDKTLVERLEEKAAFVHQVFLETNKDWSETFYRMMFYAFGLKVNAEAMLRLASNIPLSIVRKHQNNPLEVESIFMGMAGFLEGEDEYQQNLKKEFLHWQKKYGLTPVNKEQFKFARLRPIAFPPVRLAQLAAILSTTPDVFRLAMQLSSPTKLMDILRVPIHTYWDTHYNFGKESAVQNKSVSANLAVQVLINAVIPVLFHYSNLRGEEKQKITVFDWLEQLKPEDNKVTRTFVESGFELPTALASQAALQLHKNYCRHRKCLSCAIGVKILKQ